MSGPVARAARRARRIVAFAGWFGWQFLRANAVVAREILTPGQGLAPVIVEIELRCRTPLEIASTIALITLTPGTMALTLREDPPRLAVHGMHAADVEAFRAGLHELEDRLLAALRPVGAPGETTPDRRR
ncbi:MAG TPA: Na+/H+ antiporter subunit E [Pseudonocardia sp.]|nr:Na+/H+ antiporter subunit E [Pseudonocardia sp.]